MICFPYQDMIMIWYYFTYKDKLATGRPRGITKPSFQNRYDKYEKIGDTSYPNNLAYSSFSEGRFRLSRLQTKLMCVNIIIFCYINFKTINRN